jgi:hypothetical protein
MEQKNLNRIAGEIDQWKARESRMVNLFSPEILKDSAFLKQKLSFYDHLQVKYARTQDPEEKMVLMILQKQRSQLRAHVYPRFWQRLFNQITEPFKQKQIVREQALKTDVNFQTLKAALAKAGFENVSSKLEARLKEGQPQFKIPVSHYITENKKMDYQLSFSRDYQGNYRFDSYQAALIRENKPSETRTQTFQLRESIDALQARNLLEGRAIQKDFLDGSGAVQSKWLKLDFNDKYPGGNHKYKEFQQGFGFEIQNVFKQLSLEKSLSDAQQLKLLESLKNGNRESLTFTSQGRAYRISLEANPQFKTVDLFDKNSKKTTMAQLLGEQKTVQQPKVKPTIRIMHSRKNGVSI